MNVFVEPKDWDDEKGQRPIKQLVMTTESFLGYSEVKHQDAIESRKTDCTSVLGINANCLIKYLFRDCRIPNWTFCGR